MVNVRMPPTREKSPKPRPSADLADQGRKAAARKAATTVEKVARAKRAVEIDLERHGGVYPYAGGRLTAEEVLRRAGLNRALLQKPRHTDLKSDLKAWLLDIKKKQLKKSFADMTYYTAASGAGVFASGSIWFERHLFPGSAGADDEQMGAMVTNILRTFAQGPAGRDHPSTNNLAILGIRRGYV